MKTGRQIGRRSLGVVLALALLLSCTFMAAPVTAGTLLAAAEGGLSFTVPETIYLAPTESSSGSTQLLYYLNVNPDGSVPRGYSTTGTVRFSNAAASSVQITCSDTSVTLSASGSANAYSATIGGRLSSGLMPGETRTLTWTAQYTESGQTKTVRSYSVVYAPFINPVGAIAAGTANKGYDVTASCSTFIYGIHQVVNSGRICDYSYLHDLYQVESNETSTTSRIDGTGVYRYSLVNGSAVPSAYPGGAEPTQLMKSTDASPGPSSLSGTAFSWSSSHATARRVFVFGGTGRVFYDTARVTEIGQIPCFEVKSFLNGAEGSASLSTSAEDFREAAYYSMSNSSVGNTSAPLTTTQYWGGSNRTTDVVCVPSPTLGSVALTGGTQSLIHGVDRFWRSKYTVDSGSDFSEKGEAVAVAACEFVGVDKSTARARYLAEVSAARQPGSSTDAWNNYRTQMQLLAQYLGTPTATSFDFSALNNAVSALIQSRTTTLTVDPNGGKWADNSTAPKSYSQAPGTTFMPSETPTRSGYEFIGWQLSGGGSWNGTTFTFGSADCTLNAQWRQAATMQTLHIQPGYLWIQRAVSFEEMKITQAQGTTIPVPTNVYMQNKVFRGWNQPSNGTLGGNLSDIQYAVSGSGGMGELLFSRHTYTFGTAEHDGLNPIFSDLPSGKAAIAVNPDGGTWQDTYGGDETRVIIQDSNTNYQLPTVVRSGCQFNGWVMIHNVGNTLSGSSVLFRNGTSAITADWIDLAPHTLTLDPDGGVWGDTGDSQAKTVSQAYNTQYTLPTDLTKDGYAFGGWELEAANIAGNAAVHGGSLSGGVFTFGDEPRTAKPVWKELYAITVDWDDGVWLQPGMDTARSRLFDEPIVYRGYEGQTISLGSIYVPSIAGDPLNAIQSWEYRPTWTCSRGTIDEGRWVYTVGSGADTIRPNLNRTSEVGAGCVFIQGGQYVSFVSSGRLNGAYWADLGAEDTTYLRIMCNDPEWTNTVDGHESAFRLPELIRPGFTLSGWTIYKNRGTLVEDPANNNAGMVFEKNGTWYYIFDKTCMDRVDLCPVWSGEEENWIYTIENKSTTITGYTGADGGVVTIPASLGGYPVTAIGSQTAGPVFNSYYEEIVIPASVTRITSDALLTGGTAAFTVDSGNPAYSSEAGVLYNKDKTTLVLYPNASTYTNPDLPTSFTVPDSVTAIADNAFGQAFLKTVELPEGLTSIGEYAFLACPELMTVNIPDSVTTIGTCAFFDCPLLGAEGLHIPSTVTSIGENAFYGCTSLSFICSEDANGAAAQCAAENGIEFRVCGGHGQTTGQIGGTIDDNLTWSIVNGVLTISGVGAMEDFGFDFDSCSSTAPWTGLEYNTVIISDGVTRIGAMAFFDGELTKIVIADSVTFIGDYAFAASGALSGQAELTLSQHLAQVGECVFIGRPIAEVTIPGSLTTIGEGMFSNNSALTHVTIEDGVETIGLSAFDYCLNLTDVDIPDSVTRIENGAFESCESLTSLHIPGSVTSMGEMPANPGPMGGADGVFSGCSALEYVCSDTAGGAVQTYCEANGIEFRVCGSGAVPQDMISVTIGDQIGVNLLLDLDARNAESVTVVYKDLNGTEQRETFTDFRSLPQVEGGLYRIKVQIAPAQIADTVTVYIDGEQLDANVKEYCNTLIAGGFEPEVAALAQAVLDYGQAANNFFDYTDETMSTLADLSADDAKAWTPVFSDTTGKIRNVSFMALTKPEFRFYMQDITEAEAAAYNTAGIRVSDADTDIEGTLNARFVKNTHGDILIEVTGVMAEYMDETIVVTIDGLGTITFAGNDFAKLMAGNAATETLGAALYAYGAAAKACFRPDALDTVGDGMEVPVPETGSSTP